MLFRSNIRRIVNCIGVGVLTILAGAGGRPDVMKLIKEAYYTWGAEVVLITSNWQGNKEMMEGCKEAGIPAFVSRPIFRSALVE